MENISRKQLSDSGPLLPENEASAICYRVLCQQSSASPCLNESQKFGRLVGADQSHDSRKQQRAVQRQHKSKWSKGGDREVAPTE
jgi:hypothetical protein